MGGECTLADGVRRPRVLCRAGVWARSLCLQVCVFWGTLLTASPSLDSSLALWNHCALHVAFTSDHLSFLQYPHDTYRPGWGAP
jgi:hypothetical protein